MKPKAIYNALAAAGPDETQTRRMLSGIRCRLSDPRPVRAVVVAAFAAVVCAAVLIPFLYAVPPPPASSPLPPASAPTDADDHGEATELATEQALPQFGMDGRQYIRLDYREETGFGFPLIPDITDIGEKITEIADASDPLLNGRPVHRYQRASGEAVVAVDTAEGWRLFAFFVFDAYTKNHDEDASAYLEVYGIASSSDIGRIELLVYDDAAEQAHYKRVAGVLTDADIAEFYRLYAPLSDASEAYFERLYGTEQNAASSETAAAHTPPDAVETAVTETAVTPYTVPAQPPEYGIDLPAVTTPAQTGAVSQGYAGNGALDDSVTVRIYNRDGVFYDSEYYPHIGFLSRYAIPPEMASLLTCND